MIARIGWRCEDTTTKETHAATTAMPASASLYECMDLRLTADADTDNEIKIGHGQDNNPDSGVIKLYPESKVRKRSGCFVDKLTAHASYSSVRVPDGLFQ